MLLTLTEPPERRGARLAWSAFRRRHQAVSRRCHAVRRARQHPDPPGPLTVLVADAHDGLARAITQLLGAEPGVSVVGVAGDRVGAARLLRRHRPNVLLLDTRIMDGRGLTQLSRLQQASPDPRVLMMGMDHAASWSLEARRLGAAGYVSKGSPLEGWLSALRGPPGPYGQLF